MVGQGGSSHPTQLCEGEQGVLRGLPATSKRFDPGCAEREELI